MPLLVLYNPVSGDRSSKAFLDEHILPLLKQSDITPDSVLETDTGEDAGKTVVQFLSSISDDSQPVDILLCSGDGTLHELINVLNNTPTNRPFPRINLVLVPTGTANALYSSIFPPSPTEDPLAHKLKAVHTYVSKQHRLIPLNLAVSVISPPPVATPGLPLAPKKVCISAVVVSTSLHASILHDSEALRASDPSIERFKKAAQQNITRWYSASVKLFPREGAGVVEVYDPTSGRFVPHESSTEDEPIVDLEGPFVYFLSTVNVDRLEPAFRITPKGKEVLAPNDKPEAALDVVIVRPTRDPAYEMVSEETRAAFAEKAGAVLGAAYQDGAHINLRYDESGKPVTDGNGPTVVEYIRCGGWEWEPVRRALLRVFGMYER